MDINQYMGGVPYPGAAVGLAAVSAMDNSSPQSYQNLTETEKEHLILQCKDAKNMSVMEHMIDAVVPDASPKAIAEEEAVSNNYKGVSTSPHPW